MAMEQEYQPRIPLSTYRLQLNREFTFSEARAIIGYLADLGITDLYTSSYLKAREGSLHGYDIVNFSELNDEIGAPEEYEAFVEEQKRCGFGQILDLVPNHMCIGSDRNLWWMDVLENGPSSVYARFFDVNWQPVKIELKNKILVPVLGDQYGKILENQELRLEFRDGAFFVSYGDSRFPIRPDTYTAILTHRAKELEEALPPENLPYSELLSINTALGHLPAYTRTDPDKMAERNREKEIVKKRLSSLYHESPEVRRFVDENVTIFNGIKGEPRSFDLLDRLLQDQAFRLCDWRVATEEINYRRFFDVNDLAAIRVEDPLVFHETHKLVFRLIREGKVTGLRVDHPDGLYDPSGYFHRLQRNCYVQMGLRTAETSREGLGQGEEAIVSEELGRRYEELANSTRKAKPFYIIGEKILMRDEAMPEEWPIFSTTGYTFLNLVNGLFVDTLNEKAFDRLYRKFVRRAIDYGQVVYEKKKFVMQRAMSSEINTLGHYLNRISEKNRHTRDFTLYSLTGAIIEVIAFFPVYRTYITNWNIAGRDRRHIESAVAGAKAMNPTVNESIFNFLKDVLLLECPVELDDDGRKEWLDFVMRFQQLTGPVMAKGLEDAAFYVYSRLISLNEVGGSPDRFGTSLQEFHEHNLKRQKFWPNALITTSTHDSKRSEDVRARISVLSEIPEDWRRRLTKWSQINRKRRVPVDGGYAPDPNEEYFLYQTLVGTWPFETAGDAEYRDYVDRIKGYMLKALREAKINTSWINPRVAYEQAFAGFVEAIMNKRRANEFLDDFEGFHRKIAFCGMCNSLSQTLLKILSPGVPDFYQGTEIWNFSLVDPDNRRPVDYDGRKKMLLDLARWEKEATLQEIARQLVGTWKDGRIKMYVTSRALNFRKTHGGMIRRAGYTALAAEGARAQNVCAFARRLGGATFIVVAPRFIMGLLEDGEWPALKQGVWDDSFLPLPSLDAHDYENIFTGEVVKRVVYRKAATIHLADLFRTFPVALLRGLDHKSVL
ncbi:MAG: malto-oligosyltrehalose synthase [Syntrophorhabdales bacterium]|jgi:(1->4)-alpha-D-glucan 1-alpha-D-glucosylmutase